MTTAAYFECFAGASGDMILGALVDAGWPEADLRAALTAVPVSGWELEVGPAKKGSLRATRVRIRVTEPQPERDVRDIAPIIDASALPAAVKERALGLFRELADVEGIQHDQPAETVHFHEVGAVDSILDIVGACAGLHALGIEQVYVSPINVGGGIVSTRDGILPVPGPAALELLRRKGAPIYASEYGPEFLTPTGALVLATLAEAFGPFPPMRVRAIGYGAGQKDFTIPNVLRVSIGELHRGWQGGRRSRVQHGTSVPAGIEGTAAPALGPAHAAGDVHAGGSGSSHVHDAGHEERDGHRHDETHDHNRDHDDHNRDYDDHDDHDDHDHDAPEHGHLRAGAAGAAGAASAVGAVHARHAAGLSRLASGDGEDDVVVQLQTNIDDMNPEWYGHLFDRLLGRGALDVALSPVYMKKGRPGTLVSVLVRPEDVEPALDTLFTETTTLGVRMAEMRRRVLARRSETVDTPYGVVRLKVAIHNGAVRSAAPEYDDCRAAAVRHDVALGVVYDAALRALGAPPSEE